MRYVALLRGINVGGNKKVPMTELKTELETHGFTDVKTLLNSGNVVFTTTEEGEEKLTKRLETILEKKFGFTIPVLIRSHEEIQKLVAENPFQGISVKPETRLYVTFLGSHSLSTIRLPDSEFFQVVKRTQREVCMILTLSPTKNTVDLMASTEKAYGRTVTTRNWNTLIKISKL